MPCPKKVKNPLFPQISWSREQPVQIAQGKTMDCYDSIFRRNERAECFLLPRRLTSTFYISKSKRNRFFYVKNLGFFLLLVFPTLSSTEFWREDPGSPKTIEKSDIIDICICCFSLSIFSITRGLNTFFQHFNQNVCTNWEGLHLRILYMVLWIGIALDLL